MAVSASCLAAIESSLLRHERNVSSWGQHGPAELRVLAGAGGGGAWAEASGSWRGAGPHAAGPHHSLPHLTSAGVLRGPAPAPSMSPSPSPPPSAVCLVTPAHVHLQLSLGLVTVTGAGETGLTLTSRVSLIVGPAGFPPSGPSAAPRLLLAGLWREGRPAFHPLHHLVRQDRVPGAANRPENRSGPQTGRSRGR